MDCFRGKEVELQGRKGVNSLELRLGPPGFDFVAWDHKRTKTCGASTVGWPPVASFRKNVACGRSQRRQPSEPEGSSFKEEIGEGPGNGSDYAFVKVYMDGYPIGRKIDLRAYDGYEKLSFAMNDLFKGLLADDDDSDRAPFDGPDLCASKGEHTLVYEDNEGDQILVGDVPWNMFVSSARKLRVLKSLCVEEGR
ncbi:hypothetical protein MLD38_015416 [Melastoma candidum]|uniref:Uncharacterized protein n=1 Tax=Melastoma candidum TaxID=119954 RepID=A0ACB9RFN8_9MYRT|nr:hypothetical protein MLD38_015416 [Melastoma candidum]